MFGNSGYVGHSRSKRSAEALDDFEVPLSYFDQYTLEDFQDTDGDNFDERIFKLPISVWKFVATDRVGISSWHHTGKYFQMTDHYSLTEIAQYLQDNLSTIQDEYKEARKLTHDRQVANERNTRLGWALVQVWGGTRKHPKIVDRDEVYGYIKKTDKAEWLISTSGSRYKLSAKRVERVHFFNNLSDMKKSLGKKIDLRHFKKWLRAQGKQVPKSNNN